MVRQSNFDSVMGPDTISKNGGSQMNKGSFLIFVFVAAVFLLFTASFVDNTNKWKISKNTINSSTFELHAGQSAIYDGNINSGNFKNFDFKVHITHSKGAKASLWFHSDTTLSKGYSILIGSPTDDHRRSGSLASVRNLYKPVPSSFDLEVKVEGKRIVVMIDGWKVVDYLEPTAPFRTATNAGQLLSNGVIGFRVESGTLNVTSADITPLADNLPSYPEGKVPINEQVNALIRLQQRNFPVIDYHVHWPVMLGLEAAIEQSLADGFEFGIASNCGVGFPTTSDEQIKARFENAFTLPQLFYAMQGEGREWPKLFSREAREMFDYVFTDALTFYDHKGRRTHLWIDPEVIIDIPPQEYMDMIMDRTLKIINEEPIDFLASPTRLATVMMKDYNKYWTDARVAQLIKALKNNNVALEINSVSKVPSAKIIKEAKTAGVKFTLGTNNAGVQELDQLAYSLRMVEECGLTIDDMWFPKAKERYSIKGKNEEAIVATNLSQSGKVDTFSYIIDKNGDVVNAITDEDHIIIRKKGVSQELLTKYQEIVNKYLEKSSTGKQGESDKFYWKSDYLSEEDWSRLYIIYVQMTDSQKQEQMINFLEPPRAVNNAYPLPQWLYDLWIEDKKCKIWIDGEQVDNSALNSYKTTDFVRYFISSLRRTGWKVDEYRTDLWTETGHEKFSEQFFEQPISIDKLLEIEPGIFFLVEKDDNKPINLLLHAKYGWMMYKATNNGATVSSGAPTPSTYYPKSYVP